MLERMQETDREADLGVEVESMKSDRANTKRSLTTDEASAAKLKESC